jgi:fatty acid desaturase
MWPALDTSLKATDLLGGGLNYQIEHHLFPNMPRPSLRHAQPMIRAYCLSHGLPYMETSLIDSYRQALRHLHTVGRSDQPEGIVAAAEPADERLITSRAGRTRFGSEAADRAG